MDINSMALSMAYQPINSKIFQTTDSSQFNRELEYIRPVLISNSIKNIQYLEN